jgi:phosphatidate cytidylyltransferase
MAGGKSDLGVRTISAVVMVTVAGTALWLGGTFWLVFVGAIAAGVLWEWRLLVRGFTSTVLGEALWMIGGVAYVGIAAATLMALRTEQIGLLQVVLGVIATDIGAYFAGRTIGGPKIAPRISPSKTWAGLAGGALSAALVLGLLSWSWWSGLCDLVSSPIELPENTFMFDGPCSFGVPPYLYLIPQSLFVGTLVAIVAQAGDFFESWMKRRAGVKDSGSLIPGHGGLFDRVDGLLAVCFAIGIFVLMTFATTLLSGGSLLPSPA